MFSPPDHVVWILVKIHPNCLHIHPLCQVKEGKFDQKSQILGLHRALWAWRLSGSAENTTQRQSLEVLTPIRGHAIIPDRSSHREFVETANPEGTRFVSVGVITSGFPAHTILNKRG